MRRRVEHDDDQELGALAHDASRRFARLALDVQHAQSVGKTRRDGIGQERGPFRLAHLAPALLVAAEIKVDLERGFQRCRTDERRAGLSAGAQGDSDNRRLDQATVRHQFTYGTAMPLVTAGGAALKSYSHFMFVMS